MRGTVSAALRVNLEGSVIRDNIKPTGDASPSLPEGNGAAGTAGPTHAHASEELVLTSLLVEERPTEKLAPELTPFMRQWTGAKRENPDALLFFRMGDFYELFYDDATTASRELQLTLTARDRERSVPMCGVPYHAVEQYLTRLLRKGYRIALCDQMEDPEAHQEDRPTRGDAGSLAGHGARCVAWPGAE